MTMRCLIPALFAGLLLTMAIAELQPVISGDHIDCAIQEGPCRKTTGSGIEVVFDMTPRPVKAMQELEFVVTLRNEGKPVTGASLILDLSMPGMFMGNNQPKFAEDQGGSYRGRGVIPRCSTGSKIWKAFIAIAHGGQIEKVVFLFEVL